MDPPSIKMVFAFPDNAKFSLSLNLNRFHNEVACLLKDTEDGGDSGPLAMWNALKEAGVITPDPEKYKEDPCGLVYP